MRYFSIIIILFTLLSGCSTTHQTDLYQDEYLELTLENNKYHFADQKLNQGEELELSKQLTKYGTKKVLIHNFTMGDLLKVSSALKGSGVKFYFFNNENEIKQMNFI